MLNFSMFRAGVAVFLGFLAVGCATKKDQRVAWRIDSYDNGLIHLKIGGENLTAVCRVHFIPSIYYMLATGRCDLAQGLVGGSTSGVALERHDRNLVFKSRDVREDFEIVPAGWKPPPPPLIWRDDLRGRG